MILKLNFKMIAKKIIKSEKFKDADAGLKYFRGLDVFDELFFPSFPGLFL